MKKIFEITVLLIICAFFFEAGSFGQEQDSSEKQPQQKRRINWEDVEGAIEYRLQVADLTGKVVVDEIVSESSFDVKVPYGYYKVRIGAVNKFGKIGSWSDWANITIAEEVKEPEFEFDEYKPLMLRISLAPSFFYLLPEWDGLYENSFNATTLNVGISPLQFSYFKYAGLELEGTFARFESKSDEWRIETRMSNVLTGINFFVTTWFNFPVNAVFRLGGGVAYTEQEYEKFDPANIYSSATDTLQSQDAYYRGGIAAEFRITNNLFLDAGTDFYIVRFLASDLKALKFFISIGTGI